LADSVKKDLILMPRTHRDDGTPVTPANKRKLNQHMVARVRPKVRTFLIWDTHQHGLALQVRSSGHKSWKTIYSHRGRPRWYNLGNAAAISVADARKLAGRIMFAVAEGKDPQAERQAHRSKGTFEELCERYVHEYAKKKNRNWQQGDRLIRKHLLPRWGKLHATTITRSDVKGGVCKYRCAAGCQPDTGSTLSHV
jgi:Arm DNA-binding domain